MSREAETSGHSTALTAFAAVPPYWARWLRVYWGGLHQLRKVQSKAAQALIEHTPVLRDAASLTRLSIISFARWSILEAPGDPATHGSRPVTYLLFETNFNGDNDHYLEAFSLVVPWSMRLTWRLGPFGGYTVPDVGEVSKFLRHVNHEKLPIAYYYCAYPEASTKMIRSALDLRGRIEQFNERVEGLEPARFLAEYRRLLAEVQNVRNPPTPAREPETGALTVMTPVLPGRARDLEADLHELREEGAPVFPEDRTHYARWVVTGALPPAPGREPDPTSYLLFSAWFDGPERRYLEALHQSLGERGMDIWRHCGYEDVGDPEHFRAYLLEHRVAMGTYFHGYGGVTVREIRRALELATRFGSFMVEARLLGPGELQRRWTDEFVPPSVEALTMSGYVA